MSHTLLLDIENTPLEGLAWQVYDTTLFHVNRPSYMLSYAVKWLGEEKKGRVHALPDFPGYNPKKPDDTKLLKSLVPYLDRATHVIAHNGDQFDLKKIATRMLIAGMQPWSPIKTIDTLKICRRYFKFESNKLDNVASQLGVGRKLPTQGKDTWLGCMAGDPASWATMRRYNLHDVDPLLEGVYLKIRGWMANHPDMSEESVSCRVCGSFNAHRRGPVRKSKTKFQFQCTDCGNWQVKQVA